MTNFNYALDKDKYTWGNALLWGNFKGHCERAWDNKISWGSRFVHILIAVGEFLPLIGQIASIFEKSIIDYYSKPVIPKVDTNLSDRKISIIKDNKENDQPTNQNSVTAKTSTQSTSREIKTEDNLKDSTEKETDLEPSGLDEMLEDASLSTVHKKRWDFLQKHNITPDDPSKFIEISPKRKKDLVNAIAKRMEKENDESVRFKKCLGKNSEQTLTTLKEKAIPQIVDSIINFLIGRLELNVKNSGGSAKISTPLKLIEVRNLEFGVDNDKEYNELLNTSIGTKLEKLEIKEEGKKKLFAASIVDAVLMELVDKEIYSYNPRFFGHNVSLYQAKPRSIVLC